MKNACSKKGKDQLYQAYETGETNYWIAPGKKENSFGKERELL